MNTRHGRAKFKNFQIILDSVCSSTILMVKLVEKLHPEKDDVMQWHTKAGYITNSHKVKLYFTLPTLSATNGVM